MKITTVGIDLAKNVFQVHGVDERGQAVLRRQLKRKDVLSFFANLEPCLIGMEACGSAHYWARKLSEFGHTVRLMAPQSVKPYVKTNKNDYIDAEAIAEAVDRPRMRYVPIKSDDQLDIQSLHRVRERWVGRRTAVVNQIRGLLLERGVTVRKGRRHAEVALPGILEDPESNLSGPLRMLLAQLQCELRQLHSQIEEVDAAILKTAHEHEACQRLMGIPGIGPVMATAMVSAIGNGAEFKKGRGLASWLGLVPRQYSTGGKQKLLGISRRGNCYLRSLLVHGARALLQCREKQSSGLSAWLCQLVSRVHRNVAVVALANKLARMAWALLAKGETYRPPLLTANAVAV